MSSLPISSKSKVKTGWERQERERRWWKTDRVREFCVRRLRVRRVYTMDLKKVGVSSVEMVEGRLYERGRYESFV